MYATRDASRGERKALRPKATRLIALLYMTTVLTPVVCNARQDSRLEGCVDPEAIATVLGELRQERSRLLSVEQFRAMWPVELSDIQLNSKTSRTLQSE